MRVSILILLAVLILPLLADDSIFPPEPQRSIDEKKAKPMVAHAVVTLGSGSQSKSSGEMIDRGPKAISKSKNERNKSSRISASTKAEINKKTSH